MNHNDHHISSNIFDLIDSICREFRSEWKSGDSPSIDQYYRRVPHAARASLFHNLLEAEVRFRRRSGDFPSSDEYLVRYPDFAGQIRQVFDESTMMSMDPMQDTPAEDSVDFAEPLNREASFDSLAHQQAAYAPLDMPAARRIGDYELIRELGRGGMGVVYEAKHLQRQNHIALKTLPTGVDGQEVNAERLHKFRNEFRNLSEINHPNLVGMQSLEVDGGQWFFTMDLIDGTDFLSHVRPDEKLDEDRLRSVLNQLAKGITALHQRQIIHRDVKPSNVMVSHDGKVAILDFGLAAGLEQQTDQTASLRTQHFAGTPRYAAPEQISGHRSEASDWYAVGVMLYEALTGEPPFTGNHLELFEKKRHEDPPQLATRSELPRDLAELVDGLLIRDPGQRLEGAAISSMLSLSTDSSLSSMTFEQNLGPVPITQELKLIGRDEQLAQLEQAQQALLTEHEPAVVFISGRSGEGKSALAEKFLGPIRKGTEMLVLSGRCYDRESIPFKAIDCVIDSLVSFLRGRKPEYVKGLLPEDIVMLTHLFPLLRRVDAIDEVSRVSVSQLDSKQIRYRAFNAMRELLTRVGQTTPILMFIDDLQWGDIDSADVLFQMLTSTDKPAILFIGSYRSDEADDSPFLQQWEKLIGSETAIRAENIVVGPLNEEQCVSIVTARLERDDDSIREQVHQMYPNTGGNPYFIEQLIDSFDPETGKFNPRPLAEVIDRRLDRLSNKALPLLKAICVAGQAASIEEVSQVAGFESPPYSTLNHMRMEQLIRSIGSEDFRVMDTYHDKIRETVLRGLSDDERQQWHQVYGMKLEADEAIDAKQMLNALEQGSKETKYPARVFDLTFHFERAGDNNRLLLYSLLAAEQAVNQYVLPLALEHYRTAERLMQGHSNVLRFRILYGLGNVLNLTGQYKLANQTLDSAITVAPNSLSALRAQLQKADIIYKTGSLRESIAACERLLEQLNFPVPQTRSGKVLSVLLHQLRRWMHEKRLHRFNDTNQDKTALTIAVLCQATYPFMYCDPDNALWTVTVADELARLSNNKRARFLTAAMRSAAVGWFRHDIKAMNDYGTIARKMAQELNDRYGQALVFLLHGSKHITGEFPLAVEMQQNAVREFDLLGDVWRKTMADSNLAFLKGKTGEIRESFEKSSQGFSKSIRFGQHRLAMMYLGSWLKISNQSFPLSIVLTKLSPVWDDYVYGAFLKGEIAAWHLKNGKIETAILNAKESIKMALHYYPFSSGACSGFSIYAKALRLQLEMRSNDPQQEMRNRQKVLRAAKQAVRYNRKSTFDLPYALRELALNYFALGKYRRAHKCILESCEIAQSQGAKYEYAQSLLVQGQVGQKLGRPEANRQVEEANIQIEEFEKQMQDATAESIQFIQQQGWIKE